jgi:hypothetical protein
MKAVSWARGEAATRPLYELRTGHNVMELWELPSAASPRLSAPARVAGLHGRNLDLMGPRVARLLKAGGVTLQLAALPMGSAAQRVPEDTALNLALLFRVIAPMRNRENMARVAEGVEAMGREEAAYWLGMAVHRKNPRRVLGALRLLFTEPA